MSILFEPIQLDDLKIKNRFVCSATYEGRAKETGEVTEGIIKRYRNLAKGDVGLAITGYMYVHPIGRAFKYQTGIHSDSMIPGLSELVQAVHQKAQPNAHQHPAGEVEGRSQGTADGHAARSRSWRVHRRLHRVFIP